MATTRHTSSYCHICFATPIIGSLWRCFCCYNLEMCNECVKRHKIYHPCTEFVQPYHGTWTTPGALSLLSIASLMVKPTDFFQRPLTEDTWNLARSIWSGGLPLATDTSMDAMRLLKDVIQVAKEDQWKLLMERENHLHGKYFRLRDIGRRINVHGDSGARDLQIYKPAYASVVLVGDDGTPIVAVSVVTPLYTATAFRQGNPADSRNGIDANSLWVAMVQDSSFVNIVVTNLLPAESNISNFGVRVCGLDSNFDEVAEATPDIDQGKLASKLIPPGYSYVYTNMQTSSFSKIGISIRPNFLNKRFYTTTWVSPDLVTRSVASINTSTGGNNPRPFGPGGNLGGNLNPVVPRGSGWGASVGNMNPPNNYSGDLKDLIFDLESRPELRSEKVYTSGSVKGARCEALKNAAKNGTLKNEYRMVDVKDRKSCVCCKGPSPDCILYPCGHRCAHLTDVEAKSSDISNNKAHYIQGCPECKHLVYSWIGYKNDSFITFDETAHTDANTNVSAKWRTDNHGTLLTALREVDDFEDIDLSN